MNRSFLSILLAAAVSASAGCGSLSQRAMHREDWQAAIRAYSNEIKWKKDYESYYGRGMAYARLGRHREAMEDFATARAIKPNDGGKAALEQAKMALRCGEFDAASHAADAALKADDSNTEAFYVRGICAVHDKDYSQGKANLLIVREAFAPDTDESITLLRNLAIACFYLKEFAQAEQYYGQYMKAKEAAGRYLLEDDYYWAGAIADVNLDEDARDNYWSHLSAKFKKQKGID